MDQFRIGTGQFRDFVFGMDQFRVVTGQFRSMLTPNSEHMHVEVFNIKTFNGDGKTTNILTHVVSVIS